MGRAVAWRRRVDGPGKLPAKRAGWLGCIGMSISENELTGGMDAASDQGGPEGEGWRGGRRRRRRRGGGGGGGGGGGFGGGQGGGNGGGYGGGSGTAVGNG